MQTTPKPVEGLNNFFELNVVDPTGIVQVYKDFWWWCVAGDTKRTLFYGATRRHVGSPQCNFSKVVAECIGVQRGYDKVAELVQIPLAFVPWEES